jgi:hypothetical protein
MTNERTDLKDSFEALQAEIADSARAFVRAYAASALASIQTIGGSAAGVAGSTGQQAHTQTGHTADTDRTETLGGYNVMSMEDQRSLRAKLDGCHTDLARVASTALGFATLGAQSAQGINQNSMADHRDQNHNQDRKTGVLDFVVLGDAAEEAADDTDR